MKIRRLHLLNFRQHADTAIELGDGITGIIGPNGSGKTTLLEAIAWAIYGHAAARGDRDSIRNLRAKPRSSVRVELEFELGNHTYRVVRGLHMAELYEDGRLLANALKDVTDKLATTLRMTHDEFFNTYFTGQRELSVMTALGPTERGQFLSRVLGYERLRAAQELVRERRRERLGGYLPERRTQGAQLKVPERAAFRKYLGGSGGREQSTTMQYVQLLAQLLKDPGLGRYIVPIVADEARTFGMQSLFRNVAIYAPHGQLYEPEDREELLYYKEAQDGQILEEGITESGALASWIAAATSYSTHGVPMLPFYTFYSMFGFQRTGDSIWAMAD